MPCQISRRPMRNGLKSSSRSIEKYCRSAHHQQIQCHLGSVSVQTCCPRPTPAQSELEAPAAPDKLRQLPGLPHFQLRSLALAKFRNDFNKGVLEMLPPGDTQKLQNARNADKQRTSEKSAHNFPTCHWLKSRPAADAIIEKSDRAIAVDIGVASNTVRQEQARELYCSSTHGRRVQQSRNEG
jgi:hypothetical protein